MASQSPHNDKVVDQHTQQASGYASLTRAAASSDRLATLRRLADFGAEDVVLDVACGPGSLALSLAPHVARATGLDLTPAMLEQARAAQASSGCANVEWVTGDAAALPFADASFSLVASRAAFHHFERPAAVLAEMARVCRPGGHVVVIDVTPDTGKTDAYDRIERMRDPSHGHAHSIAELEAMGREVGLGDAATDTSISGPMPYEAVLATSFPEKHSREQLLALMRADAAEGADRLGFRAALAEGTVMVSYAMTTMVWARG